MDRKVLLLSSFCSDRTFLTFWAAEVFKREPSIESLVQRSVDQTGGRDKTKNLLRLPSQAHSRPAPLGSSPVRHEGIACSRPVVTALRSVVACCALLIKLKYISCRRKRRNSTESSPCEFEDPPPGHRIPGFMEHVLTKIG